MATCPVLIGASIGPSLSWDVCWASCVLDRPCIGPFPYAGPLCALGFNFCSWAYFLSRV